MKETKRERFVRVAEKRTQKVLDSLTSLGKCAHPACYEYTNEDLEIIFAAINKAVRDTHDTLIGGKRFTLSDTSKR